MDSLGLCFITQRACMEDRRIKSMKYAMLLLVFSSSLIAVAADKPVWTINTNKMNLPQKKYSPKEPMDDPDYKVQFTTDGKILISYFESRPQTELITKDKPEKSGRIFVVLLLSNETGELIKRVEWPVMGESTPWQQFQYGSRINPLYSGGYVGIFNRRLQVLDSSFNVIYDRVLETPEDINFNLIASLRGQYFVVRFAEDNNPVTEIIDSKTFKTVEQFNIPNGVIIDLWDDRLLVIRRTAAINESQLIEKKIGESQCRILELANRRLARANYIYNGTIIIAGYTGQAPGTKGFWFAIEGDKNGDLISRGLIFKPSWNTSITASKTNHLSAIRSTFDLDSKDWIEAYDLDTQQILLSTKRYSSSNIVDYAISPNGDSIVLMTKKKIELYTVSPSKLKKGDKKN